MKVDKNRSDKISSIGSPQLFLFCTATGVISGFALSARTIRDNDYISLGFWKTIFREISSQTIDKFMWGAIVAAFLLLSRIVWLRLIRSVNKNVDLFAKLSNGLSPYIICFLCALYILTIHCIIYGIIERDEAIGLISIACIWCIVFRLYRHFDTQKTKWFTSKAFVVDIYWVTVLSVLVAPFFDKVHIKHLLLNIELLIAFIISLLLAVMIFACQLVPYYSRHPAEHGNCGGSKSIAKANIRLLIIISLIPGACLLLENKVIQTHLRPLNKLNIVLIGIDTLRADHVALVEKTENSRDQTPNLRKLAVQGTYFTSAISQAPWTMPAFASILTGKYPPDHGAISLEGHLRKTETTIAEILKEAGYFTAGVVSHLFVDSRHSFDQGFDYYNEDYVPENFALSEDTITSDGITNEAIKILDEHGEKNFFLFLHYFDPHYTFKDHEEWTYADLYSGWLLKEPQSIHSLRFKRHLMNSADIAYLKDLYDEEIVYTDKHIGRLLDYMKKRGLDKNTIFIVVADHGEEFMERGWIGHTISLYEELINVPMFVVLPDVEQTRIVDEPIETRSIFTTLLEHIGLSYIFEDSPKSFLDLIKKEHNNLQAQSGFAFSSVWLPDAPKHSGKKVKITSIRDKRWKLIMDHMREEEFLFDIQKDPDEKKNLILTETEVLKEMRKHLLDWLDKRLIDQDSVPQLKLDQEEINKLKSLGYL